MVTKSVKLSVWLWWQFDIKLKISLKQSCILNVYIIIVNATFLTHLWESQGYTKIIP